MGCCQGPMSATGVISSQSWTNKPVPPLYEEMEHWLGRPALVLDVWAVHTALPEGDRSMNPVQDQRRSPILGEQELYYIRQPAEQNAAPHRSHHLESNVRLQNMWCAWKGRVWPVTEAYIQTTQRQRRRWCRSFSIWLLEEARGIDKRGSAAFILDGEREYHFTDRSNFHALLESNAIFCCATDPPAHSTFTLTSYALQRDGLHGLLHLCLHVPHHLRQGALLRVPHRLWNGVLL